MKTRLILGSLLLAASTTLFAQAPAPGPQGGEPGQGRHMRDCSKAPDPAQCEARRKEMRANMEKAREACKGQDGKERGACMAKQMCAKAPDPAKCEAGAKERAEKRQEHRREHRHEKRDGAAPAPATKN